LDVKEISLKDGACLIADVHYKKGDKEIITLFDEWNENPPNQLFLMGDIFQLLIPFGYLYEYNKELIDKINLLAGKTEVYYLRGNHDFCVDEVFKNVTVADVFVDEEKSYFLTHGDLTDPDTIYQIYVKMIRSKKILPILHLVSLNFFDNWLLKRFLNKKVNCEKIFNFKAKISKKIADIKYKTIIEGHYHQDIVLNIDGKKYINLAAFYCDRRYYVFENNRIKGYKWMIKH
jgi:UDP-2,3-diacylglucosamine hydrolase